MMEEIRERMREEECEEYYVSSTEQDEEYYLLNTEMEYEYYLVDADMCEYNDSFFINENCPFYNLITEDYPVIDDGDENNPVSSSMEKRPIAEYCDFINDYSFNCMFCEKLECKVMY